MEKLNEPGKPAFCICENKCADQLCGNRTNDQRPFIFATLDSAIPPLSKSNPKFKPLAILCGCTDRFVSDPEDRFSRDAAQMSRSNVVNFSVGQS